MFIRKILAFFLALSLSGIIPVSVALADDIYNNLDTTIDADLEVMNLTVGGTNGSVTYSVEPRGGDGKPGCNLIGDTILTVSVNTNAAVATVAPTSITFKSCDDKPSVTVTPVGAGSTIITLSVTTNTTPGSFNLAPAAFQVNVAPAVLSDITPPVIVPMISPEPNANGWNNTDVTVTWSVTDEESQIIHMHGCDQVTLEEETNGRTLTCTATSGGGTASKSVTVKIDKTKPVITGSRTPEPNSKGWNNTDVVVSFFCDETGSVQSGIEINTVAGATVSDEGSGQSVTNTGKCVDRAGNEADVATVSNINIDKTPPKITITTPADNGEYTFKQTVLANWLAEDELSEIDTAVGTVDSGEPIDTSSLGTKSFTVTATDFAGNEKKVIVSYDVVSYTFDGFGPPITISAKEFKKMSTIPVKFQLFDTEGNPVSNAIATLTVNGVPAISSGGSNTANFFRYDPVKGQYIYNLSTKTPSLGPGSNELLVTLDDGGSYTWTITIK